MRKLANLIQRELKEQEICAIYDSDLQRVWPRSLSVGKRKAQIKRFAKQHDLSVTFYDIGLCAIFEKPRAPAGERASVLLLKTDAISRSRKRRR